VRGRRKSFRAGPAMVRNHPRGRPFPFPPMASVRIKEQWYNPSVSYPRPRINQADELAAEFGLTRSAVFNLAWRVSFPILKATLRGMKAGIRSAAEAQLLDSEKLAPPVNPRRRAKRKG
jgi:hypothetical protein